MLIQSSSGIRGTIGGYPENSFSPIDIIKISSAYINWIIKNKKESNNHFIITGRDGRYTSKIFQNLVNITVQSLGLDIFNIGLTTTPTIGFSIIQENAIGGIMITASHNPKNWNGLKLFNSYGEFLSEKEFLELSKILRKKIRFVNYHKIGNIHQKKFYIQKHIKKILDLPTVNTNSIKKIKLKIVVDGINSTGGIAVPLLLKELGVDIIKMNCDTDGNFSHDPELIKNNLKEICKKVLKTRSNLGISVDPDVDRVVFICENGEFFGEENTLVSIADYLLKYEKGSVVSTLSSSQALEIISAKNEIPFFSSPVGEVNVVKKMKEVNAILGGEGNGGIIYPKFRYGRDALVAISLFLTFLSKIKIPLSKLKNKYPNFFMSKKKIHLSSSFNYKYFLKKIKKKYINQSQKIDIKDGIKIYLNNNEWIHIRKSNTENILRIFSESPLSNKRSILLTNNIINQIRKNI